MNAFAVLYILMILNVVAESALKVWLPNTGVSNKANWREDVKDCKGLIFDANTQGPVAVDSITVSKMVLPLDGSLIFNDGARVIFDENDEKCISMKPVTKMSWLDPRNWSPMNNKAVPDLEQLPCAIDDVVFPVNSSYSMIDIPKVIHAKSLSVDGYQRKYRKPGFPFRIFDIFTANFAAGTRQIALSNCSALWCECRNTLYIDKNTLCKTVRGYKSDAVSCEHPIIAEGFCTTFCGVQIKIRGGEIPALLAYLRTQSEYVHYHASYTLDSMPYHLYIVDKGNDNDGYYATALIPELERLLKKSIIQKNARERSFYYYEIITSGEPIRGSMMLEVTFGIIFGALLVTLLFFSALFVVYITLPSKNIWPRATNKLRPFLFARFENREDGNLTFERSLASSTVSLEKSFQNPLFGADIPSTSEQYFQEPAGTSLADDGMEAAEDGRKKKKPELYHEMERMEIESLHEGM